MKKQAIPNTHFTAMSPALKQIWSDRLLETFIEEQRAIHGSEYEPKIIPAELTRSINTIDGLLERYDEKETMPSDLMADLMHWCSAKDMDFDTCLLNARNTYAGEIKDYENS